MAETRPSGPLPCVLFTQWWWWWWWPWWSSPPPTSWIGTLANFILNYISFDEWRRDFNLQCLTSLSLISVSIIGLFIPETIFEFWNFKLVSRSVQVCTRESNLYQRSVSDVTRLDLWYLFEGLGFLQQTIQFWDFELVGRSVKICTWDSDIFECFLFVVKIKYSLFLKLQFGRSLSVNFCRRDSYLCHGFLFAMSLVWFWKFQIGKKVSSSLCQRFF